MSNSLKLTKEKFHDMMDHIASRERRRATDPGGAVSGCIIGLARAPAASAGVSSTKLRAASRLHRFYMSPDGNPTLGPPESSAGISTDRPSHNPGPSEHINGVHATIPASTPFEYQVPRPTRVITPARLEMNETLKTPHVRLTAVMMHLVYAASMLEDMGDDEGSEEVKQSGMAIFGTAVFAQMLQWVAGKPLVSDFVWT